MRKTLRFIWANFELIFWVSALIYLFFTNPETTHYTLCPLKNMGFEHCPGCGMGHSLHEIMTLHFKESFAYHPLGIFALVVIISRIFKLSKNLFKKTSYEFKTFTTDSGH